MKRHLLPLLAIICAIASPLRSFAAIVVSSDDTSARVQIGLAPDIDQQLKSRTGAASFPQLSLAHESFTRSPFTRAFLHGSYVQRRPGTQGADTLGYYSATFTVSANSTYQVLGNYQNSDGLTH